MLPHTMSNRRSTQASSSSNYSKKKSASPRGGKSDGGGGLFPAKLHNLLDYADENGFHDIISWTDEGRSFEIHSTEKIVKLLPLFFGQTKYRSFYRQMNMWSFERIQDDTGVIKFRHPLFRKGKRELSQDMCREIFQQTNPFNIKRSTAASGNTAIVDRAATTTSGNITVSSCHGGVSSVAPVTGDKVEFSRSGSLKRAISDQSSSIATIRKNKKDAVDANTQPNKRRHSDRSVSSDSKLVLSQIKLSRGPFSGPASTLRSSMYHAFSETFTSLDDAIRPIDDDIFNDDAIEEGDLMQFAGRPFYFVDWKKKDTSTSRRSLLESIHNEPTQSQLPLQRAVSSPSCAPSSASIPVKIPSPTPLPTPAIDVSVDGMITGGLLSTSSSAANAQLPMPISSRSSEPMQQRLQSLYEIVSQSSHAGSTAIGNSHPGSHTTIPPIHQTLMNNNDRNSNVTNPPQQQQQDQFP